MKKTNNQARFSSSLCLIGLLITIVSFFPNKNIYARYINPYFDNKITLDNLQYEEAATCLPVNEPTTFSFTLAYDKQLEATESGETSEEANATHGSVAFIINRIDSYYELPLEWDTQVITDTEFATDPNYLNAIPQTGVFFQELAINIPPGGVTPYQINWTPNQTGYYQFDVAIGGNAISENIWASGFVRVCPEGDIEGDDDERETEGTSSLMFDPTIGCEGTCEEVKAQVCNNGDGVMQTTSTWDLYYITSGDPRDGAIISSGTINILAPSECQLITFDPANNPNGREGEYIFKTSQGLNQTDSEELWSETCSVSECSIEDIVSPPSEVEEENGSILGETDTNEPAETQEEGMILGVGNAITLPETSGINSIPGLVLIGTGLLGRTMGMLKNKKKIFKTIKTITL